MNIVETFRIALTALGTNRLRALLTTLGIVIGVASVVSLMSLGGSLQNYVTEQFAGLGADILQISAARGRNTASGTQPLTTSEAEGLLTSSAGQYLSDVSFSYNVQGTITVGENGVSISVQGVTANYADLNDWQPEAGGNFISQKNIDDSARVVVLDQDTASDLFDTANPVGQTALINGQVFTVIGVMEERSTTGMSNQTALVPISTAQTRLANARVAGKGYRISSIQAKVNSTDTEQIATASDAIEKYLMQAHGITDATALDFNVFSSATIQDSLTSTLETVTLFLSVVAGISLLVGGIGVMNIMLVSVTERTREIGLRKAVGAQASTILTQFLIESILLALLGGGVGIAMGGVVLLIAGQVITQFSVALTPNSVVLATGISSLIGILSGMYPAQRAANMRPIDALRFE